MKSLCRVTATRNILGTKHIIKRRKHWTEKSQKWIKNGKKQQQVITKRQSITNHTLTVINEINTEELNNKWANRNKYNNYYFLHKQIPSKKKKSLQIL